MNLNFAFARLTRGFRLGFLLMSLCAATLLASCGAGTTFQPLVPSRFIVFGDGLSDVGQTGTLYTVNDGTLNNVWVTKLSASFGITTTAQLSGGLGYARGNARVSQKPDAKGVTATLTITEQIDAFLATNTLGVNDVVLLQGGLSDIYTQALAYKAGTITSTQLLANVEQAGKDLAAQARRLASAGGKHVVVIGSYDFTKTPYATAFADDTLLASVSLKFNDTLLINMLDLGNSVLFIDVAYEVNLLFNNPASYGLTTTMATTTSVAEIKKAVCTTPDASTCTTSTVLPGVVYTQYLFADDRHLTPTGHSNVADYAYIRIKNRW